MKLYIVSSNTWTDGWGAQITVMGVFDDKERAQKCFEKYERHYYTKIDEVMLNEDNPIYLGGYVE